MTGPTIVDHHQRSFLIARFFSPAKAVRRAKAERFTLAGRLSQPETFPKETSLFVTVMVSRSYPEVHYVPA